MLLKISIIFSWKYCFFSTPSIPKKFSICPEKIMTAIPEVNPIVTDLGIYVIRLPNFKTHYH